MPKASSVGLSEKEAIMSKKPADKAARKAVGDYGNRSLSILQPWAWAIPNLGKPVENRSKPNRKESAGGLWIHSGLKDDKSGTALLYEILTKEEALRLDAAIAAGEVARGAVVAYCQMDACLSLEEWKLAYSDKAAAGGPVDRWAVGPFCYPLSSPQMLREPVPFTGKRGFFTLPDDVVALCVAQLGDAEPADKPDEKAEAAGRMHGAKPHVKLTPVQMEAVEETLDKISDLGGDLAPVLSDISKAEKKLKTAKATSSALTSDIGKLQKHLIAIRSGTWQGRLPLE